MNEVMTCKKHNIRMKCMAGRNAHPTNWYCPECERQPERSCGVSSIYDEIHDTKRQRVAELNDAFCPTCRRYLKFGYGHNPDCKHAKQQDFDKAINAAGKRVMRAQKHAEKWLVEIRTMHGKLAVLKHENNKLRKANELLRKDIHIGAEPC